MIVRFCMFQFKLCMLYHYECTQEGLDKALREATFEVQQYNTDVLPIVKEAFESTAFSLIYFTCTSSNARDV